MSDVPNHDNGPKSTVEALAPVVRQKINEFLRDPESGSIGDCYLKYRLEQRGVSRSAFYRYASRIRAQCALEEAAAQIAPAGPDGPDITAVLPQVIARRLLTMLIEDGDANPTTLHRLTLAYRTAYSVHFTVDDRRKKTPPADPKTEAIRAQAFADIREFHERNKQEWAIRHNIAPDYVTAAMTAAHGTSASNPSEISNIKSAPGASRRVALETIPSRSHPEWESLPTNSDSPSNSTGKDSRHTPCEKGFTHEQPAPALRAEEEKKPPAPVVKTTGNHRPPSGPFPRTDPTARASIHDILNNRTRRHEKKPNDRAQHRHGIRVEELSGGP